MIFTRILIAYIIETFVCTSLAKPLAQCGLVNDMTHAKMTRLMWPKHIYIHLSASYLFHQYLYLSGSHLAKLGIVRVTPIDLFRPSFLKVIYLTLHNGAAFLASDRRQVSSVPSESSPIIKCSSGDISFRRQVRSHALYVLPLGHHTAVATERLVLNCWLRAYYQAFVLTSRVRCNDRLWYGGAGERAGMEDAPIKLAIA